MIIRSVHLQNYRRYADQTIDFPDGIIGIVGNNGAGKSTLIEAIGWCLYGNAASRTSKDCIKRTGCSPNDDCKVAVEMVIGGDSLLIERELRGRTGNAMARLYLNGNPQAEVQGMKEVSDYIEKRTGMDHVAFFTSIFARQKELNALSDLQPGERKKTIMRLLRIDRVDEAIAKIKKDMAESRTIIDSISPMLKDIDELRREGDELEKRKADQISAISTAENDSDKLKTALEDRKKEFASQEKKSKEHNYAERALASLRSAREGKVQSKGDADSDLTEAKEAEQELSKLIPRVKEYREVESEKEKQDKLQIKFKEKTSVEEQIEELKPKIKSREEQNTANAEKLKSFKGLDAELRNNLKKQNSLGKQKESLNAKINRLKEKISQNDDRRKEVEEEFGKIKDLGKDGKCPTCKRLLGDHLSEITEHFAKEIKSFKDRIEKAKQEKSRFADKVKNLTDEVDRMKQDEDALRRKIQTKVALENRLNESSDTLKGLRKQLAGLTVKLHKFQGLTYDSAHHEQIKARYKELRSVHEKSIDLSAQAKKIPSLTKRSQALAKDISKLGEQMEKARKKLDEIGFDEKAYQNTKALLEKANADYTKKREELVRLQGDVQQTKLLIQQNLDTIKDQKEKRKTIDAEKKKIESRSKLEKIMNEFRLDLIARVRPALSARASDLFLRITKGKYPTIDLDENYDVKIEDGGEVFGLERFSGGESDLANLCLRIAISQELSERAGGASAGFIVLDEIFGSQDSERKGEIMKALAELSNQFRQILLITHIDDIKESLPFVISIKEDGGTAKAKSEGMPLSIATLGAGG